MKTHLLPLMLIAITTIALGQVDSGENVLLFNEGSKQSLTGPDPLGDSAFDSDEHKATFFDTTPTPEVRYGSLGFPATAYDPTGSVIEFDYRPHPSDGNIIFVIGGVPSNGDEANMLALYKTFYGAKAVPALTASVYKDSWAYCVTSGDNAWEWDPEKWYHVKVEFRAKNDDRDFARVSVDGEPFTESNGDEFRRITAKLDGPIWFGGQLEQSYFNTPARFANIKISKLR